MSRKLQSLAATLALVVMAVGVPIILIRVAGWPLPTRIPDWDRVRIALQQGDIPTVVIRNTIATIVWIAWAQLAWALVWELAVNRPALTNGRRHRNPPLVTPALGGGISRLVALAFAASTIVTATAPTVAFAQRPVAVATAPPPNQQPAATRVASVDPARVWHVVAGDTLWDIAETALGDGSRVSEILELNPHIPSPRQLRVGHAVRLPTDAAVPVDRATTRAPVAQPDPDDTSTPAGHMLTIDSPASYLPSETIVIQPGDTLWDLAEDRLDVITPTPVTNRDIVNYVNDVIDDNAAIVEDPNLIYPGEAFMFPAIGNPPPATPPPAETAPVPDQPPAPTPTVVEAELPPPTIAAAEPAPTTAVPPVTSTSTPASTPATGTSGPATVDERGTHTSSRAEWLVGISGSTVLASGLLLTYRRRRRRQAAAGARTFVATPNALQSTESALIAASNVPLVRWAGHELASLFADPRVAPNLRSTPSAIEISTTHGIEILWDAPHPNVPAPWEAADDGWAWRLDYDPDHHIPSHPAPPPIPGLVTIGQREASQLLIDLEHFGSLNITGDPARAEGLMRAIVTELAHNDELADTYLHLVGIPTDGLTRTDRVHVRDETQATEHAAGIAEDTEVVLADAGVETTFQLRTRHDPAGRELTVIAADSGALEHPDSLLAIANGHHGIAVIIQGDDVTANAIIVIEGDGTAVLQPLGITFTAAQLPAPTIERVVELLDHAATVHDQPAADTHETSDVAPSRSSSIDPTPPVLNGHHDVDLTDDESDPFDPFAGVTLLVSVLGPPTVPDHPNIKPVDVNLIAYLATNGGTATEDQVIDAVWNGQRIEKVTLWNHLSRVRAEVGKANMPLRDQRSGRVRLGTGVTTDLAVLASLIEQARLASSAEAIDMLRRGLDLVSGVPFDTAGYDWAHEQQHHARACTLIEQAALRLIDLALTDADPALAHYALGQGLRALRVNEPLYRARMQLEAHQGNTTGVRRAYDELTRLLEELSDGDDTYGPSPRTRALLQQLIDPTIAAAS